MDTKALRQKILDLAIRGKLVPQDPNDEPASVLLERIRAQKQQMVREGKLKSKDIKDDTVIFVGEDNLHYEKLPDGSIKCIEDEIPFDLPESWAWCRIKNICTIGTGATPLKSNSAYYANGTIPWITSAATSQEIITTPADYITERAIAETNCSIYPIGTLIIAMYGEGKTRGQISELGIEACTNQACAALQILADDVRLSQYVKSYFQYGYENLRQKAKGGQQSNLNQTIIAETLIAIPPYQETKRIMDSVYQCIDQINTIEESLESICTSIENAKKRILDLAIHGQLVPQNPADEPATVLLDRIRAEKEELIRQGKIKRDKKESVIFRGDDNSYYEKVGEAVSCIDELIPFELPEGWAWVRGYSCFSGMESKRPAGVDFDYIDIDSIDNRNHVITEPKHMAVHDAPSRASRAVRAGSVLFSLVRPYLQNIAYIPEEYSSCIASTGFYVCNSSGALIPEFMFYLMLSPYVVNGLNQFMKGDNSPSISKDDIENWLYPIPPIAEQKRIAIHVQKALEQTSLIASSLS